MITEFDSPFRRLVVADLRDPVGTLREPAQLDRWRDELGAVIRDLDEQFAVHAADLAALRSECWQSGDKERFFAAEAEYRAWKARASGFKRHVVDRIQEVNRLTKERNVHASHDQADRRYRALRKAINNHRSTVEAEYEPTSADITLWMVLDEIDEVDVPEGVIA